MTDIYLSPIHPSNKCIDCRYYRNGFCDFLQVFTPHNRNCPEYEEKEMIQDE